MALTLKLIEGFETQGFQRAFSTTGTVTITSSIRSGTQGVRGMVATAAANQYAVYKPYEYEGSVNTNEKICGFWVKIAATPSGGYGFFEVRDASSNIKFRLETANTGQIYVYDSADTYVSSSAPGLGTDLSDWGWHLVEVWWQESASSANWSIYVDGSLYDSRSAGNFLAAGTDSLRFGVVANSITAGAPSYDDIYFGETTTGSSDILSQNNYNGLDIFIAAAGSGATTYNNGYAPTGAWTNIQEVPPSDSNVCSYAEAATGQTERLAPDTIATQTNLTGSVTDIDDDPDSPDANWLTASGSSTLRVTFPTPTGNPDTGAGVQNFRVLMRKNATGPASGTSSEDIVPNGLGGSDANLTGTEATIDEDPAGTWPGGDWRTASSNNANSVCHAQFGTPTGNPTTGAGVQSFWIHARLTTNGTACTYNVYLYENGTPLNGGTAIATGSLTSTTGQTIEATWNASLLGTTDGSLVECVFEVVKSGGAPASRTTGEVDAVYWECTYDLGGAETQPGYSIQLYENGSQVVAVTPTTGTLTDAGGDTVAQLSWDATELGTADGSLVECYITQTSGADRYIEFGAVEWNVTYSETEVTKSGYVTANGTGSFTGPSTGRTLDGDILLGSTVYVRGRYTGSGSTLTGHVNYGSSQSSSTVFENFGYTLTASLADLFKLITNATYIPTTAYDARTGFMKTSSTDVTHEVAEALYMMAYAPTLSSARNVTATTEVVTVSTNTASINKKRGVTGATEVISATENNATVTKTRVVTGATETVAVTENTASVNATRNVTGATEAVSVTENNATVTTFSDLIVTQSTRSTALFDTFTGVDDTLLTAHSPDTGSGSWTQAGTYTPKISSNRAVLGSGSPSGAVFNTGESDCVITAEVTPLNLPASGSSPNAWIVFRNADGSTISNRFHYGCYRGDGTPWLNWVFLERYSSTGGYQSHGNYAVSPFTALQNNVTHTLRVRMEGSSIKCWYNGVLTHDITDSENVNNTYHGLRIDGNNDQIAMDNYLVTDLAGNEILVEYEYATANKELGISSSTEVLSVTENNATVNKEVAVAAQTEVVTLTENNAAVSTSANLDVTGTTEVVTVTGNNAGVNVSREVAAATEIVSIAESTADINKERSVTGTTETIVVTENDASVASSRYTAGVTEVVTVTENTSSVSKARGVTGITEQISVSENTAALNVARGVLGGTEAVTVTENTASLTISKAVTGATEVVTVAENNAVIAYGSLVLGNTAVVQVAESDAAINRTRGIAGITEAITVSENNAAVAQSRGVTGATEVILVTENTASVAYPRTVSSVTEAVLVTENNAAITVAVNRAISATTEAITVDESTASVNAARGISGVTESVLVTENTATLGFLIGKAVVGATEIIEVATNDATIYVLCRHVPSQNPNWVEITSPADPWVQVTPSQSPGYVSVEPDQDALWQDGSICRRN